VNVGTESEKWKSEQNEHSSLVELEPLLSSKRRGWGSIEFSRTIEVFHLQSILGVPIDSGQRTTVGII